MTSRDKYHLISPWYDQLATVVFFGRIKKSQRHMLTELPRSVSVLILGGGTGWILEEIYRLQPQLVINYVDNSSSMIRYSQKRTEKLNISVDWILGESDTIPAGRSFDVIITNFYLDLFSGSKLHAELEHLFKILNPDGRMIVTDFQSDRSGAGVLYRKFMTYGMILFFRTFAGHTETNIPEIRKALAKTGFKELKNRSWLSGFIFSSIYAKKF